ncbi:hypothetical protein ACFY36_01375 [Actinoplanes sp. NPDC000266]
MSNRSSYATDEPDVPRTTAWLGVIAYGGVILVLLGMFHLIQGIVALADDSFYIAREGDLVLALNYTVWGWLHLVLGVLALAAGVGIFTGALWARVAGVVVAAVSALAAMVFMPAYPIWGIVAVIFDIVIIYALVAHGQEVRAARAR